MFNDKPPIEIEFSLNLDLPNRYKIKGIYITPTPDKVILSSVDNSEESLRQMSNFAVRLCKILTHTPLRSIGVNFGYFESESKEDLYDKFSFDKNDPFSEEGWQIKDYAVKRYMVKEGFDLNFTTTIDENSNFRLEFNYHYNITEKNNIIDLFEKFDILSFKSNSQDLLYNIYKLKLPNND